MVCSPWLAVSTTAGAGEATSSYLYVPIVGSQGVGNPYYGYPDLPNRYMWDDPPPEGTAAAFTSEQLPDDLTTLGSASLDLWLSAAAPDGDLQVTITEVRPDGQEVYVQQGWLRASQRALDDSRSTELLPYQTHVADDVAMLTPGEPVLARVEVFPFGHVFRAGSRLRVWVDAPTFLPQLWAFTPSPIPTPVTVLHDAEHPSRLVLPRVPNDSERIAEQPACGLVIRQPCRPDPLGATFTSTGGRGAPVPPSDDSADTGRGLDAAATAGTGGGSALPATGGSVPLTAVAALVAVAFLGRRARTHR